MKRTYIFNIKKYYKSKGKKQKANRVTFPLSLIGKVLLTLNDGAKLEERWRDEEDGISVKTVGGNSFVCFTVHKDFFKNYFDIIEEKD